MSPQERRDRAFTRSFGEVIRRIESGMAGDVCVTHINTPDLHYSPLNMQGSEDWSYQSTCGPGPIESSMRGLRMRPQGWTAGGWFAVLRAATIKLSDSLGEWVFILTFNVRRKEADSA